MIKELEISHCTYLVDMTSLLKSPTKRHRDIQESAQTYEVAKWVKEFRAGQSKSFDLGSGLKMTISCHMKGFKAHIEGDGEPDNKMYSSDQVIALYRKMVSGVVHPILKDFAFSGLDKTLPYS